MAPINPYPPIHNHPTLTSPIPPTTAQQTLSRFLTKTATKPHLHPDSFLSSAGISFSPSSGPRGGLALHHLQRIEAGLRGENLGVETREELDALFGEEIGAHANGEGDKIGGGDDRRLDALIAATEQKMRKEDGKSSKKKRKREEIEAWAETSSQAPYQEVESFANTPMHNPELGMDEAQDRDSYELQQSPLAGDVGGRDGAPVVQQGGSPPEVAEHDANGHVATKNKKEKTEAEKEAKRKAKKERKAALKRERIQQVEKGKG